MKRQFRVSRCENDAVAGEYESNVVVRRVLVLIQVGLAALARDKHTPNPQLDFRNDNNAPTDARSPLSRLANLRIFPSARRLIY